MKDYKRLTKRDKFGNADIIGIDSERLASNLDFDELNELTFVLNKFAELEDKIERGEIDYVTYRKTEQKITDLLIEFDEMGFVPTTVCPNSEQYATEWRERVRKEFTRLTVKNAELRATLSKMETVEKELRERLEKAVELKVKNGDTIYLPWEYDGNYGIATLRIVIIHFGHNGELLYTTNLKSDDDLYLATYKYGIFRNKDFGNIVFTDRSEAEARLAELQGGKE